MNKKLRNLCGVLAVSFSMAACGSNEVENETIPEEQTEVIAEVQNMETQIDSTSIATYDVSDEEATIYYEGETFIKSVFEVGGEQLYIHGIKGDGTYFLGNMNKEEKSLKELPLIMPEDMRIINMAVDTYGDCHMLSTSVEEIDLDGMKASQMTFEKSVITKVNKEGNTEYTIDISEIISEKNIRPFCFTVDQDGNYYLENNNETNEIIKICPDGSVGSRIPCEGEVEAIGNGKSGKIYCMYINENGEEVLGRLEENEVVSCNVTLPSAEARYSNIGIGTDTELLMYNKISGVYTYDLNTSAAEQRIVGSELPVLGQDVAGQGFLGETRRGHSPMRPA